jgi:hypothetical protein
MWNLCIKTSTMKLQFRKSFYTRTLYAGNFNTILMGILIGLQKSSFTHCETCTQGTCTHIKKMDSTFWWNQRNRLLKLLKNYKANESRKWVNPKGVNKFPNYTAGWQKIPLYGKTWCLLHHCTYIFQDWYGNSYLWKAGLQHASLKSEKSYVSQLGCSG